jgi:hypothetical protein
MVDIQGATLKSFTTYLQERTASTTGVSMVPGLNAAGSSVVKANPHFFNVLDFGAVADYNSVTPTSSTDNTTAFQAAMNAARTAKGTVFVPGGDYYFAQGGAALDPGAGGFSVVGEYGSSVLYFHEGTTGTPRHLFSNIVNTAKEHLYFHGLKIVGTFNTRLVDEGGTGYYLDHYPEIKFSYCKWQYCSWMNTDIHFSENVSFDHCYFEDGGRDSARTRECKYTSVTNCTFRRMGDDCVAFHGGGYTPGYDPDDGTPRREGLIVSGCMFLDCTSAITALGCRSVIVTGNYSDRSRGAFFFGPNDPQGSGEGSNPAHTLLIANNVILNYVGGVLGAQTIINLTGMQDPRDTAQSDSIPGTPVTGTGVFTPVWGWDNADMNDAADAYPPVQDWVIKDNIIARRLPAVTNYSDWGFGTLGSHDYDYDPQIDDDDMRANGISIEAHLRCTISGNHISHVFNAIVIASPSTVKPLATGSQIRNNVCMDYIGSGVVVNSSGYYDTVISGNTLLGDIYRKGANSNADGTYDAATETYGVQLSCTGAIVEDNKIANVAVTISSIAANRCRRNTVIAEIASAAGFSTSNKGCGTIWDEATFNFDYIHAYCDPTQSTYGTLINIEVDHASAMPSTGFYVKGHFVTNSTFSAGPSVVRGWLRVTTSSNHVLNTDWLAIVANSERLTGLKTWDPGSIAAGAVETTTVTVTGAALGDAVTAVSLGVSLAGMTLTGYVSAADTVTVVLKNETAGAVDLASSTLRAEVRTIV